MLVPTIAVRDEGTSYHYIEPKREIQLNRNAINSIKKALTDDGVNFIECKTWTTDAIYRETKSRTATRIKEGCLCVEMECSAAAAVSEFRKIEFGQILYSGDNLDSEVYDDRQWWKNSSVREKLFQLALDAATTM